MTLLLWYVLVASALLAMSTVGLYLSGRWGEASWSTRLLLLVSGSVDGMLGLALLSWLGLSADRCRRRLLARHPFDDVRSTTSPPATLAGVAFGEGKHGSAQTTISVDARWLNHRFRHHHLVFGGG